MTTPHPNYTRRVLAALGLSVLAACMEPAQVSRADQDPIGPLADPVTVDAAEGTCYARTTTPAIIETVTEQVEVTPAKMNPDGSIAKPPVYKTETRQEIVRARVDNWFETPCPDVLTVEFNSTLQRALQARGYYSGPITGEMDAATRQAVRRYQARQGPNSEVLSLTTARALGLVAVPRQGG